MTSLRLLTFVSPLGLMIASCSQAAPGENAPAMTSDEPFRTEVVAQFDEPWAMDFDDATGTMFVTEKKGTIRFRRPDGTIGQVSGAPTVDYGGQGGLGDIVFGPMPGSLAQGRTVYLSWVEAGDGDTRGAAVGRANLVCKTADACALEGLKVIWRQQPKVTGRGHYSHRIAFSPDGRYLFIASGERQKMQPAQDTSNTLGTIVRLDLDGNPAPGNPMAGKASPTDQIWSYGHRNILGLAFDAKGRLWDLEHGPRGGDELNLVEPGKNYGWPLVSNGVHYDGEPIADHATRPDLAAPAISWDPVIAPGDFIFYSGDDFPEWQGEAVIAAMKPAGIVRVAIDGTSAREVARYATEHRIREIEQGPDGAIWLLEDGKESGASRLLKLVPTRR
jgi:aldose sugar dehydrogenase